MWYAPNASPPVVTYRRQPTPTSMPLFDIKTFMTNAMGRNSRTGTKPANGSPALNSSSSSATSPPRRSGCTAVFSQTSATSAAEVLCVRWLRTVPDSRASGVPWWPPSTCASQAATTATSAETTRTIEQRSCIASSW